MSSSQNSSRRAGLLKKRFQETVAGERPVRTPQDGQLFLEAVRSQHSPSQCVEIIVSKPSGLEAVRDAVRTDLSLSFILSHTLPFLRYLGSPSIKALVDGQLLEQILLVILNPPTLLTALVHLFRSHQIPDDSLYPFGWLALELISLPPSAQADVTEIVACVADSQQFIKCKDHGARELGYKIQKVIQLRCSPGQTRETGGPGGRHDNDFPDFRKIRIYPTTDEFLSTQLPYYQTAHEVAQAETDRRPRLHLDNQFRLLREDMLAELREDIQVATGKKKGKRSALILSHLVPVGIDVGDDTTGRYKRCTLLLESRAGSLQFLQTHGTPAARKKLLKDQSSLLRHQAFGVLRRDKEILGFAFVDRDLDHLAKLPPIVSLQFTDKDGLRSALLALTLPTWKSVQFVLVDTPVFAYEPVLLGLQRTTDLPLLDLLVNPATITGSGFEIKPTLQTLVARLESSAKSLSSTGVVRLVETSTRKVEIDDSQLTALLLALKSPVSLIQGPPGMPPTSRASSYRVITADCQRDGKILHWSTNRPLSLRSRPPNPRSELHKPRPGPVSRGPPESWLAKLIDGSHGVKKQMHLPNGTVPSLRTKEATPSIPTSLGCY